MISIHAISPFGDTPGPAPRNARRLLRQHRQEVPRRLSQQEEASQPQQESGLPPVRVPRHGGADKPPDDACSRALPASAGRDKPKGKTSLSADSSAWMGMAKAGREAPQRKYEG